MLPVFWRAKDTANALSARRPEAASASAVAGELLSATSVLNRAVVVAVALGFPLGYIGASLPLSPLALMAAVVLTSSVVTAATWLKGSRIDRLLLLPFSKRDVVCATCVIGALSVAVSDGAPLALFFGLAGALSPVAALASWGLSMLFSVGAFAVVALLRYLRTAPRHDMVRHRSVPRVVPERDESDVPRVALPVRPAASPQRASEPAATSCMPTCPASAGAQSGVLGFLHRSIAWNYLIAAALREPGTWFSLLGLTVVGTVFSGIMFSRGQALAANAALLALTPPLSTLLSRNRDTRRQLLLLGGDRRIAADYLIALLSIVTPLIFLGDAVMLAVGLPVDALFVLSGVVVYFAGAVTIVALELRFPRLTWKTEREVYVHPRRYVPLLASALAAWLCALLASCL